MGGVKWVCGEGIQGRSIILYFLCVWTHVAYFCSLGEEGKTRKGDLVIFPWKAKM